MFKFRQPDDLFHTLKTVKGLLHLFPRPPQEALVVFGLSDGYIEVYANDIHLIYIGVYPHKYIGHEDNVQTGGVVRVRLYVI